MAMVKSQIEKQPIYPFDSILSKNLAIQTLNLGWYFT
jgi:hypothetical protein